MTPLLSVVLASNNPGKLKEFSAILQPAGITMVAQGELGIPEAPEPHCTFVENALAKARHASSISGKPALADDSGLCVEALNGAPGVYSARYAVQSGDEKEKSDAANNRVLVRNLAGQPNRNAFYVAVLVYLRSANDPCPIIAEGLWPGEIVDTPKGDNGFGYDSHFYISEFGKTVAQLLPQEKNQHSHRAQALVKLLTALRIRNGG